MANLRNNTLAIVAVMLVAVASAQATSHVRIVRLSYEDGSVQMSRATGQGLERAILNSPIVEGSSVVTGTDGLAEVEFENNSTVRLGQATDVRFRQLLINDAGELINEVELVRGTMYFDTRFGKNNIYRVVAADRTFVVPRKSQVRFMMNGDEVEVSVLNGEAQLVNNNAEIVKIKKNDTLNSDASNSAGFTIAKGVDGIPLDRWNNERAAYQTVYAYNNTGYGFVRRARQFGGIRFPGLGVLRWLHVPARLRNGLATLWRLELAWLESLPMRRMGVHAGVWLRVGIGLSLGLVALSLWRVGILARGRLVLGPRQYDRRWRDRNQLAAVLAGSERPSRIRGACSSRGANQRAPAVDLGGTNWPGAGLPSWRTRSAELRQRNRPLKD